MWWKLYDVKSRFAGGAAGSGILMARIIIYPSAMNPAAFLQRFFGCYFMIRDMATMERVDRLPTRVSKACDRCKRQKQRVKAPDRYQEAFNN